MSAPRPARADRFCAPAPRGCPPPPRGQNPAVPAYFFHRSGPARGGSPPAPSCPARAAGRGKPPYFGRFCPVAAPPSGRAHSHKSIAKKWKIFMECSLQFLSIFTNLFYNESSTQPRSGRARAPGGGAGRTLSGQIVPFVHRSRFPSPVFRLPGTRTIPPPGRRRADASVVSFVRPLHAERLRPQAPPGVQHHIGKGECL